MLILYPIILLGSLAGSSSSLLELIALSRNQNIVPSFPVCVPYFFALARMFTTVLREAEKKIPWLDSSLRGSILLSVMLAVGVSWKFQLAMSC